MHILPNDDDKTEEVALSILSSPINYISCLLTAFEKIHFEPRWARDSISVKKWFLKTVVQIIVSPEWMSLTEEAFDSALEIISLNYEESCNLAQELGFSPTETKLFKILLNPEEELFTNSCTSIKDYEFIQITFITANLQGEFSENIDNIPDIFQIIYLLIRLNQQKNSSDLITILERFKLKDSVLLKRLISYLGNYGHLIENISLDEEIERFKKISKQDLHKNYFNLSNLKIEQIQKATIKTNNLNKFKELINNYPILGMILLMNGLIRFEENEEALKIIAHKIIQAPRFISAYPSIWGLMTNNCPEKESDLRQAFLLASSEKINNSSEFLRFEFHTLKISLPSEASLLPHLINSFLMHIMYLSNARGIDEVVDYKKTVAEIVDNVSDLEQISNTNSQN